MGSFGDTISAILSRLAQLLGLKPSEKRRLELMEQKLAVAKASNVDRLESLKDKIKRLESQALRKKQELEAARGDSKRIVAGSIEQLFRDLDRLQGQEQIIRSNIERVSVAQDKVTRTEGCPRNGHGGGRSLTTLLSSSRRHLPA